MKKIILFLFTSSFSLAIFSQVHLIRQEGLSFNPNEIQVNVGDTIRWEWTGGSHTTTSLDIPEGAEVWDNPLNSENQFYEYKVLIEGVYSFKCTPHQAMGMTGSFTVVLPLTSNNISVSSFSIYPNPANDIIFIDTEKHSSISIYNISGQKIQDMDLSENTSVNIEQLNSGIYFVKVTTPDESVSDIVRIVKL